MKSINEIISETIKDSFEKYKKELQADKTYIGNVVSVISNHKYIIHYDNADRKMKTKNISLSVGKSIHIKHPNGDSTKAYIEEDVLSSGDTSTTGVLSVDGLIGDVVLTEKYAGKSSEHTHSNLSALNSITLDDIENWDSDETDPTVPAWAKEPTKPSYSASEVGAADTNHTHNYAASSTPGGSANKAIADESGNNIKSSYASSLEIVGTSIKLKSKSGKVLSSGSITTTGIPTSIGGEPATKTDKMIWIEF